MSAYWSGLFDGEGCVTISITHSRYHQLRVEIQMTDREPLELLLKQYGGTLTDRKPDNRGRRRPAFRWMICSRDAVPFLEDILPYSIVKAEEIRTAIEFQSTMFQGQGQYTRWNKVPDEEVSRRNAYRIRLQELKRRNNDSTA